ncbi:hypothetical protein AMTRI_Chr13g119790 [Amborella trichopoda]
MVLYISVYINPSLCISVSVCVWCACVCVCVKKKLHNKIEASENSIHICMKEARVCVLRKNYIIKLQTTSKALKNTLLICMKEVRAVLY